MNFNKNPIYWFSAGTIIRQLVSFIMLPIYTSYLSPADYGTLALLTAVIAVYELFLGAQFGRSLPKFYFEKNTQDDKDRVVTTALSVTLLASVCGMTAFYFSSPFLAASAFENPALTFIVGLYSIMLLTASIESYVMLLFRLKGHPAFFFFMSLFKLITQLSLNIYTVVYLDMGLVGVMYSAIISSVLFAGISLLYTVRVCKLSFDKNLLKPLFLFTWPLWLAGAWEIYVSFSTKFFIKELTSLTDVGIYFLAQKFAFMMTLLIWRPFSEWWQTERFKIIKNNTQHYRLPLIFSLVTYSLLAAAVVTAIMVGTVLKIMVNESFYPAFGILFILCFNRVFFHLTQIFYLPILHVGKTKLIARLSFIRAVLITLLLLPMLWFYGVQGAALALLVGSMLVLFTVERIAKQCFDMKMPVLKSILLILMSFVYTLIAIQFVDLNDTFLEIVTKCSAATLGYLAILSIMFYFDRPVRTFCFDLVLKRNKGQTA